MNTNTDLLKRWRSLHLEEKACHGQAHKEATVLRNILCQIDYADKTGLLSPDATNNLLTRNAEKYANILDSTEEDGGVNNYADGVLALLAPRKNESKQWKSALTVENVMEMECVKDLIDDSKAASASLVPPGKENAAIMFFKHPAGPSVNNMTTSANQNQPLECRQQFNRIDTQLNAPARQSIDTNAINKPALGSNNNFNKFSSKTTFEGNNVDFGSSVGPPKSTNFWNMCSANTDSSSVKGNLPSKTRSTVYPPAPKRSRQDDEDQEESGSSSGPGFFKTAREQLAIDSQKKFGRNRGSGATTSMGGYNPAQQVANTMQYGTAKKSLGTRRSINSKFVPPVLNREDDEAGTAVRKSTPSRDQEGSDEPVDERLKNIDPKMIELIQNEIMDHGPPISWEDIAGLEFAKKTIKEIVVWPMLRPDIFTGLRGPPKGLLLFGPPGTGKTLIGKCIASQSKSTFFSISASSLTSKWVGEGEKMVRALFAVSRVHQPAVIFIDEIDSLLSQRSDGEHEASRRIKTEFLVQLDGATTGEADRILVVGATNRPQEIDEAARRRFVKRLYIPLPEDVARRQIVNNLMREQRYQLIDQEIENIIQKSQGYSGADMANLCREAALGPVRSIPFEEIENITASEVRPIVYSDFVDALKQVRASVSEKDLDLYIDWNSQYGSWGII